LTFALLPNVCLGCISFCPCLVHRSEETFLSLKGEKIMINWYEIRVEGHLEAGWLDWFEGLQIQNLENGETSLIGLITDQLALRGVLDKLWNLGLTLLSLHPIGAEEAIFLLMRSKGYYSMIVKRNNQLQILFGMRNITKCTSSLCVDLMENETIPTNLIDLKGS
jgi:hypothetical protein